MFGPGQSAGTLSEPRPKLSLSALLLCTATLLSSSALAQDYTFRPNHTKIAERYAELREEIRNRPAVKQKVPPYGYFEGVNVSVSLTPIDILDVDDVRQVVRASAQVGVAWRDPALGWDTTGPNGHPDGDTPYVISLLADDIWKPEVYIMNAASTEQGTIKFDNDITVTSDGSVLLYSNLIIEFTCKMNLRTYPFDKQKCRIMLSPNSHVQVKAKHAEYEYFPPNLIRDFLSVGAEWTYEGQTVEEQRVKVKPYFTFTYVEYTWTMARKTTYYIISFIAPIVLTSYMNVVVFLIPVESGERISYLVTIFVSTAVFVSFCTQTMPQGLEEAPLLMYLVSGVMAQNAVLVIVCSLVLHRHYSQEQARDTDTETNAATSKENTYTVSNQSFQDKDQDFTPTNHYLQNIGRSKATRQHPRDIDIRFASTNAIQRDELKSSVKEAGRKGNKSGRVKAQTLDAICFVVSLVINTVYNVVILAAMMRADD